MPETADQEEAAQTAVVFTNDLFLHRSVASIGRLLGAIGKVSTPPNRQTDTNWRKKEQEDAEELAESIADLAANLVGGMNGIGKALERSALASEAMANLMVIDMNASIEKAVADAEGEIASKAVETYKSTLTTRKFLGQTD